MRITVGSKSKHKFDAVMDAWNEVRPGCGAQATKGRWTMSIEVIEKAHALSLVYAGHFARNANGTPSQENTEHLANLARLSNVALLQMLDVAIELAGEMMTCIDGEHPAFRHHGESIDALRAAHTRMTERCK